MKNRSWGYRFRSGVAVGVAAAAALNPNTTYGCLTADDRPAACAITWPGHQGGSHFHLPDATTTSSATDFRAVVDLSKVYELTAMAT